MLAAQIGSRHNYAIPAAFEASGVLEAFYTDLCGTVGIGRLAKVVSCLSGERLPQVRALGRRQLPPRIAGKSRTFDWVSMRHLIRLRSSDAIATTRLWEEFAVALGERMAKAGFGAATHLFSVMHETGHLLAIAKARGLVTGADVCIAPSWQRILRAEHERYPGWDDPRPTFHEAMGPRFRPYATMLDHADIFVCPSEFVRADLVDNFGVEQGRTRIVPYAVAPSWFEIAPRPERGRVLFAGTADLRKGIHIFAQASQMLMAAGDHYEFRVAGEVSPRIRARPEVGALTFLGRVPRDKVHLEFQRADVVVLPSLVEGSAGVTYEALASGVPTVTTRAAGSVVRHGTDGLIVKEGNPLALAEAIAKIVSDRPLRDRMSISARDHARTFSWEQYRQRLLSAVLGGRAAGSFASDEH